jgi:hypothetical protein
VRAYTHEAHAAQAPERAQHMEVGEVETATSCAPAKCRAYMWLKFHGTQPYHQMHMEVMNNIKASMDTSNQMEWL